MPTAAATPTEPCAACGGKLVDADDLASGVCGACRARTAAALGRGRPASISGGSTAPALSRGAEPDTADLSAPLLTPPSRARYAFRTMPPPDRRGLLWVLVAVLVAAAAGSGALWYLRVRPDPADLQRVGEALPRPGKKRSPSEARLPDGLETRLATWKPPAEPHPVTELIASAQAETETVVCLHVGSSSSAPATSSGAPSDTIGVLFFGWAMFSAVDWLYSKVALRFPDLKLCLSEGGIGWVAGLLDRLDHVGRYQAIFGTWEGIDLTPREVMQRNFWFCTIDDVAGLEQRHRIGVDHLLLESDYPHQDGTWPDTQEIVWSQIGGFPPDETARIAWRNAAELFRHPVPVALQSDPDAI